MAAADAVDIPAGLPTSWNPAIESLVRSLDEARYFRGSLIVVHGPPGIGKSRLIGGALAQARVSHRRIRRTFLERRDAESPYKAILSLARWAAKLEEIAPGLDSGALVLAPFVRAFATADAAARANRVANGGETAVKPPGSRYERLFEDLEFYKRGVEAWGERSRFLHEVGWMILDASARRHVVWIVESAQYLDPHSLSLIRYLAGCLDESPLVMWLNVDTPADGRLPPAIAALVDGHRRRAVEVDRLTRGGVAEILGWKHPGRAFPNRVVESILEESRGLLLSVEQLASDPAVLRPGAPGPVGASADALAVALRSYEGLPATSRHLIEKLSVAGESTSLEMAARLAKRPDPEVRETLVSLVGARLMLEQDPDQYFFRLTALPEEIAARLPPERLRAIHREVAEALEATASGPEDLLFDLAEHWRRAEAWENAARVALSAARFSSDSFAPEGGLLQAQRALDAYRHLAEPRPAREAEALVEMGRALYDLGRLHESVTQLREALVLLGSGPDAWPLRASALFYLARALSSLAQPKEALEVCTEASSALAKIADDRSRLMLHQVIGVAFMMTNQNAEAAEHFRAMLSIARALRDPREISYAQKNLSAVLLSLNPQDAEGWRLVDAALEHHRRAQNFAGMAAGYLNRGLAKLDLKDEDGALPDFARSREAAELAHAPLLVTSATLEEAKALLRRSDLDRAEALLRQVAPWIPAMEDPSCRISFTLLAGRIAEARERWDEAERLYAEATGIAEPGGDTAELWESRLRRAALRKRLGDGEGFERLRGSLPSRETVERSAPALVALCAEIEGPPSRGRRRRPRARTPTGAPGAATARPTEP
jgi:tetratricopeptide (TPR) repeat protein